jgi:hypothetical protein
MLSYSSHPRVDSIGIGSVELGLPIHSSVTAQLFQFYLVGEYAKIC